MSKKIKVEKIMSEEEIQNGYAMKITDGLVSYVKRSWKEYQKIYKGTKQTDEKFMKYLLDELRKQKMLIGKLSDGKN